VGAHPVERRLAAIMFTDIVGYTALMSRDELAGRRVRESHR
jgi:class 3 adenylate cyclase